MTHYSDLQRKSLSGDGLHSATVSTGRRSPLSDSLHRATVSTGRQSPLSDPATVSFPTPRLSQTPPQKRTTSQLLQCASEIKLNMVEKCKYCASEIKPYFEYCTKLQILSIEKSYLMPIESMLWSPLVVFRYIFIAQNISENIIFVSIFFLLLYQSFYRCQDS